MDDGDKTPTLRPLPDALLNNRPCVVDPGRVDPDWVDPGWVDPGRVDPGWVDPDWVDPDWVDPGRRYPFLHRCNNPDRLAP